MSFANPPKFFSHPATAAAAFLLLVGATVWMEARNPKKHHIEPRFDKKYCCKEKPIDEKYCGKENPYFSTDSAHGFKPSSLYAMLEEYDEKANDFKDHRQFIKDDFIFPFAYAIPFAILILWLQAALSPEPTKRVWWLFLIPLAAGLFDLGENFGMSLILSRFEADKSSRPDGLVYFTVAMNVLKWLMVYASLALILSGAAVPVLRKAFRYKP